MCVVGDDVDSETSDDSDAEEEEHRVESGTYATMNCTYPFVHEKKS